MTKSNRFYIVDRREGRDEKWRKEVEMGADREAVAARLAELGATKVYIERESFTCMGSDRYRDSEVMKFEEMTDEQFLSLCFAAGLDAAGGNNLALVD